ncbi:MAG: UbiA-like polyprenyltransferase [Verrucomicrobiota bacterium]
MIGRALTFIRFSHTIFAMPFALGAMLVAANGLPPVRVFALIVLAMVFARTAAMVFNRLADWNIDQRNPRTAARHKLLSRPAAVVLLIASSVAFIATTWWINRLCFLLAPAALLIVLFYSLTKRFTSFSHFFLGFALAVSPVGAWLAVTGHFALPPLVLAAGVMLWVAGFDLIYATQDFEFDRKEGLNSLVVRIGVERSLKVSQLLHVLMFALLVAFGLTARLGVIYFAGMVPILGALVYEHQCVKKLDINAINRAFFNSNAFVGAVFVVAIFLDRWFA